MEKNHDLFKRVILILFFISIIAISAYIVVTKVIKRNSVSDEEEIQEVTETVLKGSSIVTELSIKNPKVKELYNYIDDQEIDLMALNEDKKLSWDFKSFVVVKNIGIDDDLIEQQEFEDKYYKIFNDKLDNQKRESKVCGSATYGSDFELYKVNVSCFDFNKPQIRTYLKNITLENGDLKINKYYTYVDNSFEHLNELGIYTNKELNEESMIVEGIKEKEISDYISNMNILSYVFKKDKDGEYYLYKVIK